MISTCQRQTLTDIQTLLGLPASPEVKGSAEAEVPGETWRGQGQHLRGGRSNLCVLEVCGEQVSS